MEISLGLKFGGVFSRSQHSHCHGHVCHANQNGTCTTDPFQSSPIMNITVSAGAYGRFSRKITLYYSPRRGWTPLARLGGEEVTCVATVTKLAESVLGSCPLYT